MDDNMNYNQINDIQTSGESQPVYQEQPYQPEFQDVPPYQEEQPKTNGFAIAGMVCGIVAAVIVCCFFPVSILCGIAGIILSIIALAKKQSKGMAIAGIITSVVAILLSVVILVVSVIASFQIMEDMGNGTMNEYYNNEMYDEFYDDLYDSYF